MSPGILIPTVLQMCCPFTAHQQCVARTMLSTMCASVGCGGLFGGCPIRVPCASVDVQAVNKLTSRLPCFTACHAVPAESISLACCTTLGAETRDRTILRLPSSLATIVKDVNSAVLLLYVALRSQRRNTPFSMSPCQSLLLA